MPVLFFAVLVTAGWTYQLRAQQWEYKAIHIPVKTNGSESVAALNKLGSEGWELVAVQSNSSETINGVMYFKRPKQ
jgi:ribosomal protein S11